MQTLLALTPTRHARPPLAAIDQDDEDSAWDFPVQSVVRAADAAALVTLAARSIFDMAAAAAASKALRSGGRFGDAAGFTAAAAVVVTRDGGTVLVVGAQYPANRWTDEREEQERQRRARQKPPKPTRRAKTRGKKVRAWDGEEFE